MPKVGSKTGNEDRLREALQHFLDGKPRCSTLGHAVRFPTMDGRLIYAEASRELGL